MKHLFFSLVALFTVSAAFAQKVITCTPQKSFWYIINAGTNYTLTLNAAVTATDLPQIIMVGGHVLQYLMVEKKEHIQDDAENDDVSVLIRYATSELQYISGQFETNLNMQMQLEELPESKKKALYWFFEMPEEAHAEVKVQHFMQVVLGDRIFGIASSQFEGQNPDEIKAFLIATLDSLRIVKNDKNLCK